MLIPCLFFINRSMIPYLYTYHIYVNKSLFTQTSFIFFPYFFIFFSINLHSGSWLSWPQLLTGIELQERFTHLERRLPPAPHLIVFKFLLHMTYLCINLTYNDSVQKHVTLRFSFFFFLTNGLFSGGDNFRNDEETQTRLRGCHNCNHVHRVVSCIGGSHLCYLQNTRNRVVSSFFFLC